MNHTVRILAIAPILVGALLLAGCNAFRSGKPLTEAQRTALEKQAKEGGYKLITPAELHELVSARQNMILIDATPAGHFREHHILGATSYSFPNRESLEPWDAKEAGGKSPEDYKKQLGRDPGLTVIVYDEDGDSLRGHAAAAWGKRLGFVDVRRLAGGIATWQAAGYETRALRDEP
ncbi:hypothetical protein K2Y11_05140 [bacterium]|nr:hypothetical protein [bacterium]